MIHFLIFKCTLRRLVCLFLVEPSEGIMWWPLSINFDCPWEFGDSVSSVFFFDWSVQSGRVTDLSH